MKKYVVGILTKNERLKSLTKKLINAVGLEPKRAVTKYNDWYQQLEKTLRASDYETVKNGPLISIIVPCFNTSHYQFQEMIYSVTNQFYQNWELVLINASDDKECSDRINAASEIDERIQVLTVVNRGIAANTNVGIKHSHGDYIALLDHDDTLAPHALAEVATMIRNNPKLAMVYSDEDKVSANRRYYSDPFFKPNISPELLGNVNYITHFSVVRKDIFKEIGLLNSKTDGAQDYDLFLRVLDTGKQIIHIPKVLYHWRTAKSSTARDISTKAYIFKSGETALKNHLARNNRVGEVGAIVGSPGFYKITYQSRKKIALVFLTNGNRVLVGKSVKKWLSHLKMLRNLGSVYVSSDVASWLESEGSLPPDIKIKSFSRIADLRKQLMGSDQECGILIVRDFIKLQEDNMGWVEDLAGLLENIPGVLSASPLLVDKAQRIVSAGYSADSEGLLARQFVGHKIFDSTDNGYLGWVRNVDCPGLSIFMIRGDVIGSYQLESLLDPLTHAEVIQSSGLRSVVWSHAMVEYDGSLAGHASQEVKFIENSLKTLPQVTFMEDSSE